MSIKATLAALAPLLKEQDEQAAFRLYITDALYVLGAHKAIPKRFIEIMRDAEKPADRRTPQQVIEDITRKYGITIRGEDD